MRVLEVFGEPISNGGQESFVVNTVTLLEDDIHIDMLTPYYCDNEHYKELIEKRGGSVYSLNLNFNPGGNRGSIVKPLKKFLSAKQYDLVHVHSGSISILTLVAIVAKKCGVKKVIVHSHCGIERSTLKNIMLRYCSSLIMYNKVDLYCACSYEAAIAKYTKKVAKKTVIIKNGVDTDKFKFSRKIRAEIRKKLNIPSSSYVIGHVGRFNYQKNHSFLIDVFKLYYEVSGDSVLLLIGTGELESEIKEKVKELGIFNKVRFVGNINNVNDYMQAMDVFVLPSYFEGLPIVGVEAQAAGLPVVVSQNVSKELAITKNVIYSKDFSVDEWVKLIDVALKRGRNDVQVELVSNGFDLHGVAKQLDKIYRELCKRSIMT